MKIIIIMSTFNGESYIDCQLKSIFQQIIPENFEISLVIRDDGSWDSTVDIIHTWQDKMDITLIQGSNIGYGESFIESARVAPFADYYMFSDQDDYWYPEKIYAAWQKLKIYDQNKPLLYYSNFDVADSRLIILKRRTIEKISPINLPNILLNLNGIGSTMMFNCISLKLLTEKRDTLKSYRGHDSVTFVLVLLAYGIVIYDPEPSLIHRLHSKNISLTGNKSNFFDRIKSLTKSPNTPLKDVATEILQNYNEVLLKNDREILLDYSLYTNSVSAKIRLVFFPAWKMPDGRSACRKRIKFLLNMA